MVVDQRSQFMFNNLLELIRIAISWDDTSAQLPWLPWQGIQEGFAWSNWRPKASRNKKYTNMGCYRSRWVSLFLANIGTRNLSSQVVLEEDNLGSIKPRKMAS